MSNTRRCTPRCYTAQSSFCNCICDGSNHGIDRARTMPQQQSIVATSGIAFMPWSIFVKNDDRLFSEYIAFGSWWRDGSNYPIYKVRWIEDTGELYATEAEQNKVEILAVIRNEKQVRAALEGWRGICGLMNSLDWIRNRVNEK